MAAEWGEQRAIETKRVKHLVALCAALLGCVGILALSIPSQGDAVVLDAWLPHGGDGSYEEAMTAGVLAGPTDELRVGSGSGSRGRSGVSTELARTSSLADGRGHLSAGNHRQHQHPCRQQQQQQQQQQQTATAPSHFQKRKENKNAIESSARRGGVVVRSLSRSIILRYPPQASWHCDGLELNQIRT